MAQLIGLKVRDEFGTWVLGWDDGAEVLIARQGDCEVALLDHADFARFGLEMPR